MKIIAYDMSRVSALFPFEEIAPVSGTSAHTLIKEVADRYHFSKSPGLNVPKAETDQNGLRFENGAMKNSDGEILIWDFTIFGDGVVISARTTEDSELFWEDISSWITTSKGFRNFTTKPDLRFFSQIVVEFDQPLEKIIKFYESISKMVSDSLSNVYGTDINMQFARFELDFDKITNKSSLIVPKFMIERRIGTPFSRERYLCSAPLRTTDHIDILEKIEQSLG